MFKGYKDLVVWQCRRGGSEEAVFPIYQG